MSVSDPIADMLTKVRNAVRARHEKVDVPTSKLKLEIVKILKTEGYIKNFKKVAQDSSNVIRIFLKYDDENVPVIHDLQKVSKTHRHSFGKSRNYVGRFGRFYCLLRCQQCASTGGFLSAVHSYSARHKIGLS